MTQSILYQLDCVRYYKIRQTIVLILRPSEHAKTSTSKCYISRSTCLKFNLKTVLNSDNHGGSNSRTAALIITLAKSVLSPLAAPLCTVIIIGQPPPPSVIIIFHRNKTPPMSLVSSKKLTLFMDNH